MTLSVPDGRYWGFGGRRFFGAAQRDTDVSRSLACFRTSATTRRLACRILVVSSADAFTASSWRDSSSIRLSTSSDPGTDRVSRDGVTLSKPDT